jgi:hypothetical protein
MCTSLTDRVRAASTKSTDPKAGSVSGHLFFNTLSLFIKSATLLIMKIKILALLTWVTFSSIANASMTVPEAMKQINGSYSPTAESTNCENLTIDVSVLKGRLSISHLGIPGRFFDQNLATDKNSKLFFGTLENGKKAFIKIHKANTRFLPGEDYYGAVADRGKTVITYTLDENSNSLKVDVLTQWWSFIYGGDTDSGFFDKNQSNYTCTYLKTGNVN